MGNTCKPMAVSFQYMTKPTTIKKKLKNIRLPSSDTVCGARPSRGKSESVSCSCELCSLQPHGPQPARLLCPGSLQARILECVAMPSSRGSSRPRDRARVSRIAGRPRCGRALFTFFSRCRSPVTRLWCSFPALLPVDVWGISSLRMCGEGCVAMHVLGEQTHTSVSPEYLRGESQSAPTVGNTRRLCKAVTQPGLDEAPRGSDTP